MERENFSEDNMEQKASPENEISILALAEIPGVGFATIRTLFNAFKGNIKQIWITEIEELQNLLKGVKSIDYIKLSHNINKESEKYLAIGKDHYFSLKEQSISIILRGTAQYPSTLNDLKSPPAWLFVQGDVKILQDAASIAMVGTREPSETGISAAKRLSTILVTRGCIILSGLAEGIDAVGHRTAVEYGAPTIAVIGHGINVIYPASTSDLRQEIVRQGGAIVSEYLPKDMYNRERFVQRNRIQAALSRVVAVVEGKAKSGTAHTVRFARELNRPLFGVRLGSPSGAKQQELLMELIAVYNSPVFDLSNTIAREELRDYLSSNIPFEAREARLENPRLFRGLLKEIERISRDYDAEEVDFDWLITQISKQRDRLRKAVKDGNQSGNS